MYNYGKFASYEDFINALVEFSKKTDKDGYGIPYSVFAKEHGVSEGTVDYHSKKIRIQKAPSHRGKAFVHGYGPFKNRQDLIDAIMEFDNKTDENGRKIPFSRFAEEHGLNTALVYNEAQKNCKRRYKL